MDIHSKVNEFIYDKPKDMILVELDNINNADFLHIYMDNYNWDNGFDIPKKIIQKDCCELSTALMIFYLADGTRYLENRCVIENISPTVWTTFIEELYTLIICGNFIEGDIFFEPPLSKVQLYKLKKSLQDNEEIFIKVRGSRKLI